MAQPTQTQYTSPWDQAAQNAQGFQGGQAAALTDVVVMKNPADMLRAGLEQRSAMRIDELMRHLVQAGMNGGELAVVFRNMGIPQSTAANILGASVAVLGESSFTTDYSKALSPQEKREFNDAGAGKSSTLSGEVALALVRKSHAAYEKERMELADKASADSFASLSVAEGGHLIGQMLFSPGHGAFFDQMVANGQMSRETADLGKGMAARLPAETDARKAGMDESIDKADMSPEERRHAEEFKKSKEAKQIAETEAKIKQLKELEEVAKKNGDKAAAAIEAERIAMQQKLQSQIDQVKETAPKLSQVITSDAGNLLPTQQEAKAESKQAHEGVAASGMNVQNYREKLEAAKVNGDTALARRAESELANAMDQQKKSETAAKFNDALSKGGVGVVAKLEEIAKSDAGKILGAEALIVGSKSSELKGNQSLGKIGIATGVIGTGEIANGRDAVLKGDLKKTATVASTGSNSLDDDGGPSLAAAGTAAPAINLAVLGQMRAANETAALETSKTAAMKA